MKKILLSLAVVSSLAGCATTQYNYTPKAQQISEPAVGSITTAYVGEHMLKQGKMVTSDAVRVVNEAKVMIANKVTTGIYVKVGSDETYDYYKVDSRVKGYGSLAPIYGGMSGQSLLISKAENKFCVLGGDNINRCSKGLNFVSTTVNTPEQDSFQQTLIYSGKIGNKINVSYREFSSDLARPAFNNDVEYDLSESSQIGYKGALLDVQDANNQMIKYKVIRNFNTQ